MRYTNICLFLLLICWLSKLPLHLQDDGSHFRICCLQALEDEVNDLKKDVREEVETRLKLQLKIQQMSKEIEELKKLVKGFS